MDAIIAPNTVPLANVAAPPVGTPGYPTDGNPGLLIPATNFPAYHYASIIRELLNVIGAAGITPSSTDNGQLLAAIETLITGARFSPTFVQLTSSGNITAPVGAGHIEAMLDGAGGGGADCEGTNQSGGGGGSGGHLHAVWPVAALSTLSVLIGTAGSPQSPGGNTQLSVGGAQIGFAGGGQGAIFLSTTFSSGGGGGSVTATGSIAVVQAIAGAPGSDGQAGALIFAGNGAPSRFGGGGRAGFLSGVNAPSPGAGGGGAYQADTSDVTIKTAGNGGGGYFAYRWLP